MATRLGIVPRPVPPVISTLPSPATPSTRINTPLLTVRRIASGQRHVDEDLNGIFFHDDYASYFALLGVGHGACNAHHLRELQALIEIEKEDWATSTHRLLTRADRVARYAHLIGSSRVLSETG